MKIRAVDAIWLLEILETVAARAGVAVRFDKLGDLDSELRFRSGTVRLKGRELLIVDSRLPPEKQCEVLLKTLGRIDLSGMYVPPVVRRLLADEPSRS